MISKKTYNILIFFLPSIVILAIIIFFIMKSEAKSYVESLKNSFESSNVDLLVSNLSRSFYQENNLLEDDVRKWLENFFENYHFPEVYIRYRKIERISDEEYQLKLLVRVLAVPQKGTVAGIYGDRRVIVFGDGLRGRSVILNISRTSEGFIVDSLDIGKSLEEKIK